MYTMAWFLSNHFQSYSWTLTFETWKFKYKKFWTTIFLIHFLLGQNLSKCLFTEIAYHTSNLVHFWQTLKSSTHIDKLMMYDYNDYAYLSNIVIIKSWFSSHVFQDICDGCASWITMIFIFTKIHIYTLCTHNHVITYVYFSRLIFRWQLWIHTQTSSNHEQLACEHIL